MPRQATRAVLVHDPDGVNPYGRELALCLAATRPVTLLLARDAEWLPDGIAVHAVLPGNRGSAGRARQALALLHGMVLVLRYCGLGRHDLLVAWSRTTVEDVLFALLAKAGVRVVVVEHNPRPRSPLAPARLRTMRLLRRAARAIVTHGESLAATVRDDLPGKRVDVCMHPPFDRWWSWARAGLEATVPDGRIRLLLLGRPRPDKGVDQLHEVLAALSPGERQRLVVRWCGSRAQGMSVPNVSALVRVEDHTSTAFLSDRQVARCLEDSTALLAPMHGATQSGSVILALCAGLQVLAYDDGELAAVVTDDGLATRGDASGLADRIRALLHGEPVGGPRMPVQEWRRRCEQEWGRSIDT